MNSIAETLENAIEKNKENGKIASFLRCCLRRRCCFFAFKDQGSERQDLRGGGDQVENREDDAKPKIREEKRHHCSNKCKRNANKKTILYI